MGNDLDKLSVGLIGIFVGSAERKYLYKPVWGNAVARGHVLKDLLGAELRHGQFMYFGLRRAGL